MTNPLKQRREHLEHTFALALDQLERAWEQNSTKAEPVSFNLMFKVALEDGQEIVCNPVGTFGTEPKN